MTLNFYKTKGKINMAEYYTKAESDAKYAATSHTHDLETMGGNNLPADRVEVPESVCGSFDNAYTMDEALDSIADQLSGKANTNHSHSGYAPASHTHDGYAAANHTHTLDTHDIAIADDSSVAFATTDTLFDALENLDNRIDGRAPLSHIHTNYAETDHTHTAADITGLPSSVDAYSKTQSDARYAPASHTHGDYMTESDAEDAFAPINHSHSGYAASNHSHTGYASSGHTHTASEVGAAAATHSHTPASIGAAASSHTHSEYAASNHGHTGYADEDHTHTAAEVGALPASGGTVTGATTFNNAVTIKGKNYTQQILPFDGGSYSIGASDNRYYSTYLRVNPNVSSDRRCKRDIETMDIDALAAFVAKLSVVNYNYNDDAADEAKRIGLIAQDVVAADPTIATGCIEQDEKGFYSLRAADLVFPLIAAVQALTKRVEELEGK